MGQSGHMATNKTAPNVRKEDVKHHLLLTLITIGATLAGVSTFAAGGKFGKPTSTLDPKATRSTMSSTAVASLKRAVPSIQQISRQYGVSAEAIAGILTIEIDSQTEMDAMEDSALKNRLIEKGEIGNNRVSFGPAQLQLKTAIEAEQYVAALEKRPPKGTEQIKRDIMTLDGSIRLIGATLRKIQDRYRRDAVDISNRPEILATVYNIGIEQALINRYENSGSSKSPRPNAYGRKFIERKGMIGWMLSATHDGSHYCPIPCTQSPECFAESAIDTILKTGKADNQ